MRLTIPHWFDFGDERDLVGDDLMRPEAWDALRTRTGGSFALPETRSEWEASLEGREDIRARAEAISRWLDERGAERVASYGVGGAPLELFLHRLRPERRLVATDYAPATVERLARVFPEAEVVRHDLRADPPLEADVHLLHRVDTELSNRDWRALLRRFARSELVVVASEVADLHRLVEELLRRRYFGARATRVGYLRTRGAYDALWRRTHAASALALGDLDAWHLTPRR